MAEVLAPFRSGHDGPDWLRITATKSFLPPDPQLFPKSHGFAMRIGQVRDVLALRSGGTALSDIAATLHMRLSAVCAIVNHAEMRGYTDD